MIEVFMKHKKATVQTYEYSWGNTTTEPIHMFISPQGESKLAQNMDLVIACNKWKRHNLQWGSGSVVFSLKKIRFFHRSPTLCHSISATSYHMHTHIYALPSY